MTKRLQVRCQYSDTLMHIQGVGEQTIEQGTNIWRPYGMAAEYRIPKELNDDWSVHYKLHVQVLMDTFPRLNRFV